MLEVPVPFRCTYVSKYILFQIWVNKYIKIYTFIPVSIQVNCYKNYYQKVRNFVFNFYIIVKIGTSVI